MPKVRLALVQTNPVVGDISGNVEQIFNTVVTAAAQNANLVMFGEMSVTGYPIEDLAARESFIHLAESGLEKLAKKLADNSLGEIAVVVGHPAMAPMGQKQEWALAQNCASVLLGGKVIAKYAKHHLPNYSVFDEYRNFAPGNSLVTFEHLGLNFSILICEDIWQSGGPVADLAGSNTDVTLVLNGSPFEIDKDDRRLVLVSELASKHSTAVAYVNLVGGQDDLVFDGDSIMVAADGKLIGRGKQFEEDLICFDITSKNEITRVSGSGAEKHGDEWQIWNALVLGLRDYVKKNKFKSVILGLSGGIDSAVCASLAADAIGAKHVYGVSMPSKYSSDHSRSDAQISAERIGLNFRTEPIENLVSAFESQLGFVGIAAENLQARLRGVILMGISNSEGHLVLTTGNKTELAVGYSTIYGDAVGGFAPLKDVEKTLVWKLAKWRNAQAQISNEPLPIPENSISKPPSAELRPGQTDQDSLPDYETLDSILDFYVEKRFGREQLVAKGFDPTLVERVISLVDNAEWKRRQGAIGPKITGMAFGRDRRLPITNRANK